MSISLLMHALVVNVPAWVLFRGIAGLSIAGGYMVVESWLNERVTNDTRGAVFSVYMVVSMAALMAGQFIVPLGNPLTATLFMVCAIIYSLALIPTGLSSAQSPQPLTEVSLNLKALYQKSPCATVGSLLSGMIGGAWLNLAPVFANKSGLTTTEGAMMLAIAMLGGALFQIPLGRVSDRIDRRYAMAFAGAFGTLVCFATVILGTSNITIFLGTMFLLGMVLFPIYALNVAHANDFAEPHEFVMVSSGLLIIYGVGTMLGPLISGLLMDRVGISALFSFIGVSFALYGAHAYYRTYRRERVSVEERVDFQAIPVTNTETPQTYELDPRGDVTEGETG